MIAQLSVLVFICKTFAQERNGRELVSVLVNISSQKVKNRDADAAVPLNHAKPSENVWV